jgi:LuxR family transcriptional regulator, maltose regulon positive regulatory protein
MVDRQELVARLVAGADRKLTLLCAPAGWGKTALLSEWHAAEAETRPFAWVQLEPSDDDPVRLWSYVIAALRTVEPGIGASALAALPAAGPALIDAVLPPLLNELASLSRPIVFVLDDYHLVREQRVHESIAYLLRHLPRTVQLAIASRADPPLPLGSLRAANDVNELRVAELRFDDAEAEALLNGSLELALQPRAVALLSARTEGWAAGLQLAALSLRGQGDKDAFVEAFAGDDRQIVGYLHEIVEAQPAPLREFLLQSSVLEGMCARLCDAVTAAGDGRERLEEADRANLFLVALDSRGEWYRYHHLFRDLLRHELARAKPGLVAELHRRASGWHREHGDIGEAIAHATAAGDFADAAELIARHWRPVWNAGLRETVARWIDALPRSVVLADARVCLARGWTALFLGASDEVEPWARAAEQGMLPGPLFDGISSVDANVALLRAVHANFIGDVGRMVEQARLALGLDSTEGSPGRAIASFILARSVYFGSSEPRAADDLLMEALPSLVGPGWAEARISTLGTLALVLVESGQAERARRALTEAEGLVAEHAAGNAHTAALVDLGRGSLLALHGDAVAAEAAYERAANLLRASPRRLELALALLELTRLKHRRKDSAARALVREAREVLAACPDPGVLAERLVTAERALQLTPGRRSVPELAVDAELSERELAILRLLASELSQREIGAEVYISLNTVKGHVRSIFRKLGVDSRAAAVGRGRELGLL